MDFTDDVSLRALDDGAYEATLTDRWWIVTGPNGGLLGALLLRAVLAHVGPRRPELVPRIVTVQFLSGPREGPVQLRVEVDKDGRRVSFASVAMTQDGTVLCQAKVTLVAELDAGSDLDDHVMPRVPRPEDCPVLDPAVTFGNARRRWHRREVDLGEPGVVAAWLRLDPPVPIDAAALVLMCDNLPPSLRSHIEDAELAERTHTTTIEMTTYLRRSALGLAPADECLVVLRSASVLDGLHQEEGEVWSSDGRLLATSRQLALVFLRPGAGDAS